MNITIPYATVNSRIRHTMLTMALAATTTLAAAQDPQLPAHTLPTNPALGPAFATKTANYVPVLLEEIPGWKEERFSDLYKNFSSNCKVMQRRHTWTSICAKLSKLAKEDVALRQLIFDEFFAYQILTSTQSDSGKLTGYFEPLISGSLQKQGAYQYPVYGMPADMYMVDSRTVAGLSSRWLKVADGRLVGAETGDPAAREYKIDLVGTSPNPRDKRYRIRIDGNTIRPYYTRQQIDAMGIKAPVLAWVADPFKLYSMQIQGSGKIQIKDGGLIRLAYAEQNGQPFMPNATRGDSDTMLMAIKARGLEEPLQLNLPIATRGSNPQGLTMPSDPEVARIVAALLGQAIPNMSRPSASAKPVPTAKRPAPRPAAAPSTTTSSPVQVDATTVDAMIQLLLDAPVADSSYLAQPSPQQAVSTQASTSKTNTQPTPAMDIPEETSVASSKPVGQAVGQGSAVPATGIPDPSYVFFRRISDGPEGPIGALGVPLSAGRSMAVDPRAMPLGAPVFIEGTQPGSTTPMRRMVFAQDTGGAIRGSIRGDFFWGFGDKAGKMALATNQSVRMWVFLPKSVAGDAAGSGIKTRGSATLRDCVVPDEEFCVED